MKFLFTFYNIKKYHDIVFDVRSFVIECPGIMYQDSQSFRSLHRLERFTITECSLIVKESDKRYN